MKHLLRLTALLLLFSVCRPSPAQAADFSVGAVASVLISPYKSYDTSVLPLPFISFDSERIYAKGTNFGVRLLKNDRHELSIGGAYLGLQFKPSKTDSKPLKNLDKRRSTLNATVSYSLISKIGLFRAQLGQDVLGHSKGMLGNLSWHVPWITDCFTIMPGVGVEWASSKHNEYYFGISRKEAARSGLKRYNPGNTVTPYLTLEGKYSIADKWDLVVKGRVDYLTGRVKDSPMVGKSYTASIMTGVQYTF